MRPRISELTEWKLDRFAMVWLDGVDVGKLPVVRKVEALVREHESFVESEGKTWPEKGSELEGSNSDYYVKGFRGLDNANLSRGELSLYSPDEYRRVRVDDEIVEDLENVAEELAPIKAGAVDSFDDTLNLVLEEYNSYARHVKVGWYE